MGSPVNVPESYEELHDPIKGVVPVDIHKGRAHNLPQ